jgi:phospholipid/cholesterol/gamma-HCH transport system substrate-binding protein
VKRARVYVNLGVFAALFFVLLVEATRSIITVGAITHPYTLNAQFTNGIGVLKYSEVAYLGVPVGEVAKVTRVPGGVNVMMSIGKKYHLPQGSIAGLGRKSAIGEQYIDFEPPAAYHGQNGPWYPAGYTVPMAPDPAHPEKGYTTVPLEFSEFLRSAANLIGAIPADALSNLVHQAAIGLNGRTDSLRALTEGGDKLSGELVTRTQTINQLLTNNTKLTHLVTDHRQSLGQSITDLKNVAQTLQAAQGDTSRLLDKGAPLLQQVADIVAAEKGNLDCSLKSLANLIDMSTTPRKQQELTALLDVGPRAFNGVWDSLDFGAGPTGTNYSGPWIRVGMVNNSSNPAPQYVPTRSQPVPPPVAACSSPLRPDAPTYRPTNVSAVLGTGRRPLPPVVGYLMMSLCLALAALAVLRRRAFTRPRRIQ